MAEIESFNPYAAPKTADCEAPTAGKISFDGECLIIPKEYKFPPICLKSGATTDLSFPRIQKLTWAPTFGFPRNGKIEFYLSKTVARGQATLLLLNAGLLVLTAVLLYTSISFSNWILAIAGFISVLVGMIFGRKNQRFLWAKRIDQTHIWLCGVSEEVARKLATPDSA